MIFEGIISCCGLPLYHGPDCLTDRFPVSCAFIAIANSLYYALGVYVYPLVQKLSTKSQCGTRLTCV